MTSDNGEASPASWHTSPNPTVSGQPQHTRPNTHIHYPLFTKHSLPIPAGPLNYAGWECLTRSFPDREVMEAILCICQFGARIGYEGHRRSVTIYPNLASAMDSKEIVTAEISKEVTLNRLACYTEFSQLPQQFTASPLGLTDKSDGSKRRIHHLSYPTSDASSINGGIPEDYGTINYSRISEAIMAVQRFGKGSWLIKRDFENAFRHVPVAPLDTPLLGFEWEGRYYAERFLPFGLRTAPYIFNLFAEVFHWVLTKELENKGIPGEVVHYLDDFLAILPLNGDPGYYGSRFAELCREVGLSVKESKSEEGTAVSFGGVEIDTADMVIRLPLSKLHKAQALVSTVSKQVTISLLELQSLTGYLNFAAIVIPLGRTFLRRLYNLQLYFPAQSPPCRRRISREAQKDLRWWESILAGAPERSIRKEHRERVYLWSDAAGSKGLGAYYVDMRQASSPERSDNTEYASEYSLKPHKGSAFSMALPRFLLRQNEHINTKELRAVEQALLYWGKLWTGTKIVMHIDNRAVVFGLENMTMRGTSMDVLRRCLLLAANHDLEIEPRWIPTSENKLADALSRFDHNRIANLAPQLVDPTCNLRARGFLTFKERDYQR